MRLEAALTEFSYAKDHTPASRRWYRSRLTAFTTWVQEQGITDIDELTAPLIRRYVEQRRTEISATGQPLSSHILHGHVRAIKALLNWAVSEDVLDEKVVCRVTLPKREQKVLAIFTEEQLDRLMRACYRAETAEYSMRDRTMLALLLDTGIRANELCGLTLDRLSFTAEDAYLLVNGKGRKQREVPLGKRARQLVHKYIHRYRPKTESQHVFLAKGGNPLTTGGLDRVLYRLRDRAGRDHFQGVRVSARSDRRKRILDQ